MTVRDFMNYLIYVEHSAENLQFYLWYKDYANRFRDASTADIALSPEWTEAMEDDAVAKIRREHTEKIRPSPEAAAIFRGTDFEKPGLELPDNTGGNPFGTPPHSSNGGSDHDSIFTAHNSMPTVHTGSHKSQAAEAFQSTGARLPCKCIEGEARSDGKFNMLILG